MPFFQFIHLFLHPFFLFLLSSSSSSIRLVVWRLRFLQPERDLLHCWPQHQEAQRHQVAPLPRPQLLPAFHLHDGAAVRLLTSTPHLHDGTALSFRTLQYSYGTTLRLQISTTGHSDSTSGTTYSMFSDLTTVQTTNMMVQFYYWPNPSASDLPARILEPLPSHFGVSQIVSLYISSGLFT